MAGEPQTTQQTSAGNIQQQNNQKNSTNDGNNNGISRGSGESYDPRLAQIINNKIHKAFSKGGEEIATGGLATNKADKDKLGQYKELRGVPAINNWYAIVNLKGTNGENELLFDQEGKRKWYEDSINNGDNDAGYSANPTTTRIVDWGKSDIYGRTPYFFSDFAFCKYWQKIPNNHMITLRRFPYPVYDNLEFPNMQNAGIQYPPVAQAVTFLGEETGNKLESLLTFSSGLLWEEVVAAIHEQQQDSVPGAEDSPFASRTSNLAKGLGLLTGTANFSTISDNQVLPPDPYQDGPYANRIQGPVTVIDSVQKRKRGIKFENKVTLNFQYHARPLGGMNTKAVALDIISNMLLLTSATATFWGGVNRFRIASPAYPFLGGTKGVQAWYNGDPGGYFNAVTEQISSANSNLADTFFDFLENPIASLKSLAAGGLKFGMAHKISGQKPHIRGIHALLTGDPVGEWHVVIGNPLNPIGVMGNMICTGIEIVPGNELGPDDFPLDWEFKVSLEHGMPRDRDAIESVFNKGAGRIYSLPDSIQFSSSFETKVDANTGRRDGQTASVHPRSLLHENDELVNNIVDGVVNETNKIFWDEKPIKTAGKDTVLAAKYGLGYFTSGFNERFGFETIGKK